MIRVHFRLLRPAEGLRESLLRDGWALHDEGPDSFGATHPAAADEDDARDLLLPLDILTSPDLEVRFEVGG
jgi:hypothetical protein